MELKGRYPENLNGTQRETHITYILWILLDLWSVFCSSTRLSSKLGNLHPCGFGTCQGPIGRIHSQWKSLPRPLDCPMIVVVVVAKMHRFLPGEYGFSIEEPHQQPPGAC